MTKETYNKLKDCLYIICSNFCASDYIMANYKNGKRKSKKHIPYSLSLDSQEAKEIYDLLYFSDEEMDKETEERIKGYIMKIRVLFPKYLIKDYVLKGGR